MITFKSITIRNFMSVGQLTQTIVFDSDSLTLVLGNNLDLGGNGSRNGTGKTTLLNALSFALYGQALTKIKKDNLINKNNGKNMLVVVEFEKDGKAYRIERGRRPDTFAWIVGGVNTVAKTESEKDTTDDIQGEGRHTQDEINNVIGMNHTMFKHILALNTYTTPFLSERTNDQRLIIEQLLGITQLSEKSDNLKKQIKLTKDAIKEEDYRIKGIVNANEKITNSINDLKIKQMMWADTKEKTLEKLAIQIAQLSEVDIDVELKTHKYKAEYDRVEKLRKSLTSDIAKLKSSITRELKQKTKIDSDIAALETAICYACGGHLHDDKHEELLTTKLAALEEINSHIETINVEVSKLTDELDSLPKLDKPAKTVYDVIDDVYNHQSRITDLENQLVVKNNESDPYEDQIIVMKNEAIQEVDWSMIEELRQLLDHQEFLLKLLVNKDSFIRKKIIEQSLHYLNSQLESYLAKLGLPHEVVFQADLSVEITDLGRDLDFDNLSRGERNRLILGLAWAFRDVFESMNSAINLLFIDELIDNGLDYNGVDSALSVIKKIARERNKNIFLVSHRDELTNRIDNILNVTKELGFTTFSLNGQ